ncbi:MAG TPA: efflux RND transporter periplasmic adaptor subunit [Candidatus Methylacidiphilales bacterium]
MKKSFPRNLALFSSLLILAALGAAAFAFLGHRKAAAAAEARLHATPVVPVSPATRSDLKREAVFSAEFRAYQIVDVHAKVAGYVQSIPVDIGDRVKQGATLARLEIPELQDDLDKARASTLAAGEREKRAQADLDDAALSYSRLADVAKQHPDLIAAQDLDTAKARAEAARAAVDGARHDAVAAKAEENKMLTLLDYATIAAPFDGVVVKRYADLGTLVQAGTASSAQAIPIVRIAEENVLRLDFPVQESLVPQVRPGKPVTIVVDALGRTLQGKIARVTSRIDDATRTMRAEVEVGNPDLAIVPGMTATVTVTVDAATNALSVPVQAFSGGKTDEVLVLDKENRIERRAVKTGMETATRVEILDGLRENDLVLVAGKSRFEPGLRAEPKIVAE